jgi:hypothetical protein
MRKLILSLLALLSAVVSLAQNYDAHKAFTADPYLIRDNAYRSANGSPGAGYWQNAVNYSINASFDTSNNILKGTEIIEYSNKSPDSLDFLWLELDQNADMENSLAQSLKQPGLSPDQGKGFKLSKAAIWQNGQWKDLQYLIEDTRMQLRLQKPLAGGHSLKIKIDFSFRLLSRSAQGRAGILETKNGKIYEFGYWFPRLCVYDDLRGWNTLPFRGGGEFYLEYGNIDYKITAPAGLLAAGAGELLNGKEALNANILHNISIAKRSDTTVLIRSLKDMTVCPTKETSGKVTWHFQMKNTRDVAFALSKAFIWDGAGLQLENGKTVFVQSFYPEESISDESHWELATEFLKASIADFSKRWLEYPYPEAVSIAGKVGGMEFPAFTFDYYKLSPKSLWTIISHEIGHTWFPMIVGSDERRYPFMDEGFNTFIDIYAQQDFHQGEFAPKRDGEYAGGGGNPADEIIPVIAELQDGPTLMTPPDRMDYKYVHPLAYFKTAFGMVLLREVVLGPDRFDYAFRNYIKRWAFKHPAPVDFFRSMDNAAGADLGWFWKGWFYHNWQLDQAVTGLKYVQDDVTKGSLITIENKEQMPMPVPVTIKEANGAVLHFQLPVEVWQRGGKWEFQAPTTSKVTAVIIDEKHQLPDIDRSNNEWPKP